MSQARLMVAAATRGFQGRVAPLVLLVCLAGCSSDSTVPDGPGAVDQQAVVEATCGPSTCNGGCCSGGTCVMKPTDKKCGTGGAACQDCAAKQQTCTATGCQAQCTFETGCADTGKYCDVGKCVACPVGKFNCDKSGQCECTGGCIDTKCRGAASCDYYDTSVCSGNTAQWCSNTVCTACSKGFFNCNKTKGCECDSAGCNGDLCAGKCSGGECP